MPTSVCIRSVAFGWGLAISVWLAFPLPASAQQGLVRAPSVSTLSPDKFDAMPDDAPLTLEGRTLTKGQFLGEMAAKRERVASRKPPSTQASGDDLTADFTTFRAQYLDALRSKRQTQASAARAKGPLVAPPPSEAPDTCTAPKITAVSASPPVEPGEEIILNGCGFGGSHPSNDLRLVGGFPTGFVKLQVLKWHNHAVQAKVPALTGVKDDAAAKLQLVTKDLQLSNTIPMPFRAARDVVELGAGDVQVQCKLENKYVKCPSSDKVTLSAFHGWPQLSTPATVHVASADMATIALKNSYVLAGYAWWWYGLNGVVDFPAGFVEGASSAQVKMNFSYWVSQKQKGIASYGVRMYAVGPIGVPHR